MLRKQAAIYGAQWDRYLSPLSWAYRNEPHETHGDKPLFLLFGYECWAPSEAALLPPNSVDVTIVSDYREHVMLTLSSARKLAIQSIKEAQAKHKKAYDRKSTSSTFKVGDWVLVKFSQEESGRMRKRSRPWHGPYRVMTHEEPDITADKVYFPEDKTIRVRLSWVAPCPTELPPCFYWYGIKRHSPGRPPKWLQRLLNEDLMPEIPLNKDGESEPEPEPESDHEPEPGPEPERPIEVDSLSSEHSTTEDETCSEKDEAESEQAMTVTPSNRPKSQKRYSFRKKIAAPDHLFSVKSRLRSSLFKGGNDVTDLFV